MNDKAKASSGSGGGERIYSVDAGTRRLNWFLVGGATASAIGVGCLGIFGTPSSSVRIMAGLVTMALLVFAMYGVRYNQLTTFLYPDRIVSRGLFTQASLRRDDIAGYELIPESSGPATLKLTPKDRTHKDLHINRFSPDDEFRTWLSGVPDLRLTTPVLRRKRRFNIIVAGIFSLVWCALLAFGLRQNFQQYDHFMILKSRGVATEGYIRSKSVSGRSHTHYITYTYECCSSSNPRIFSNEIEIDASDYQSIAVRDRIPVVYDPVDPTTSYPNPDGLLFRINPHSYLKRNIIFLVALTLFILIVMGGAYIADSRIARQPLPLDGSA